MTLLTLLSPASLLAGIIVGFCYFRRLDIVHKGITVYLLLMLVIDLASRILEYYFNHNLVILIIYSLLELCAFLFFYYKYLYRTRHRLIILVSTVAIAYILWELVTYRKIEARNFQSYAKVADNFVIITLVLGFFHERITAFKDSKWENFGLNVVVLVFFSINLIFFLPYNFIINSSGLEFYFWLGILITTVLFYIYLGVMVWKNSRLPEKGKRRQFS